MIPAHASEWVPVGGSISAPANRHVVEGPASHSAIQKRPSIGPHVPAHTFSPYSVHVVVYEATELLNTDAGRGNRPDPYVTLSIGPNHAKTTVRRNTTEPLWNEIFDIPVTDLYGNLEVVVLDADTTSRDDLIGRVSIPLATLQHGAANTRWYDLVPASGAMRHVGQVRLSVSVADMDRPGPHGFKGHDGAAVWASHAGRLNHSSKRTLALPTQGGALLRVGEDAGGRRRVARTRKVPLEELLPYSGRRIAQRPGTDRDHIVSDYCVPQSSHLTDGASLAAREAALQHVEGRRLARGRLFAWSNGAEPHLRERMACEDDCKILGLNRPTDAYTGLSSEELFRAGRCRGDPRGDPWSRAAGAPSWCPDAYDPCVGGACEEKYPLARHYGDIPWPRKPHHGRFVTRHHPHGHHHHHHDH